MTVRRNDSGTYAARVDMGRTLDGRRDQRQRTFPTRRKAARWEHEQLVQSDALHSRSGKITLRAYIEG